jgi:hypothetical protein
VVCVKKCCDVKLIEGHVLEGQRRVLNTSSLLRSKSGSSLSTSEVISVIPKYVLSPLSRPGCSA